LKPQHYFEVIAKARGLHWTSIKMAHDAGCLRFCREYWENDAGWRSDDFDCYAVMDIENPCNVQFRRLDAGRRGQSAAVLGRRREACQGAGQEG